MDNNYTMTQEMYEASEIILRKRENVFITGKAGTGKTSFLHMMRAALPFDRTIVAAPTGIAALTAKGQTIHSLFCLPFGPIAPVDSIADETLYSKQARVLRKAQYLIIDEISMLRCDVLDAMDRKLRIVKRSKRPFGGLQLIMIGDLFQLPPVISANDATILKYYYGNKGYYFFDAMVWKKIGFRVIELSHVFRQKDQVFIEFLNKIRNYQATQDDFSLINSRYTSHSWDPIYERYIHLCSLKSEVSSINEWKLKELNNPVYEFSSIISGTFPESSMPCEKDLKVSVGSRVMLLVNDSSDQKKFVNGSLGTVTEIYVSPPNPNSGFLVNLDVDYIKIKIDATDEEVKIKKTSWDNIKYTLVRDRIQEEYQGSCTQFPIRLAWATTIHKSQGLTFDNVALHLRKIFSPGQLYVALSRCSSLAGIITDCVVSPVMLQEDDLLLKFTEAYRSDNNFYIGQDITYEDDLDHIQN